MTYISFAFKSIYVTYKKYIYGSYMCHTVFPYMSHKKGKGCDSKLEINIFNF